MHMNKCKYCGVLIDEDENKCPLCNRNGEEFKGGATNVWYPAYGKTVTVPQFSFASKVLLFISITVVSICVLINMLTGIKNPWSLFVVCPVLYLQLLINNTILSKMRAGTKILLQIIGISGFLFFMDLLSGFYRWSVNIVIPFLLISGTFLITLIVVKKNMLWNEYVGYIIAMIFLGFLPVILYLTGVANEIWASAVSALYSFLTTIGMLVFSNKKFKKEMTRRFHI